MGMNCSDSCLLCQFQFSTLPSELPSLIDLMRSNVSSNFLRPSYSTFACNTNTRRLYLRGTKVFFSFATSTWITPSFLVYWYWSNRSISNLAPSRKNWKLRNLLVQFLFLSRPPAAIATLLAVQIISHRLRTSSMTFSTP